LNTVGHYFMSMWSRFKSHWKILWANLIRS
jgi:hypothetical protein